MYETFAHTADVGLRIRAATLEGLLADAARGLTALLVEHPEAIEPASPVPIRLPGGDPEEWLVDWLSELLVQFSGQHRIFTDFAIHLTGEVLEAVAAGETFDPARHGAATDIKAVTYHGIKVERDAEGWRAEVILDI